MAHELHQQYPASPTTPALARDHLSGYLRDAGLHDVVPVAAVVVSEVVTNAVVHAGGSIELHAWRRGATLHVDVYDSSEQLPRRRDPDLSSSGGRGLHIVAALATGWGAVPRDAQGKSTWFELDTAGSSHCHAGDDHVVPLDADD